MDEHTAQIFVRDAIFDLTMTTVAPHLSCIPLSDVGITSESAKVLGTTLGLDPATVLPTMTIGELNRKVAAESRVEVRIERTGLFEMFL